MTDKLNASFPYPPYDIQQQFMINVVDTLEQKQIGLFESPTGDLECSILKCVRWPCCMTPDTPPSTKTLGPTLCRNWQDLEHHMQHIALARG